MNDQLSMQEEEEIRMIRESRQSKSVEDLNKKNLSQDDMDEIFCEH